MDDQDIDQVSITLVYSSNYSECTSILSEMVLFIGSYWIQLHWIPSASMAQGAIWFHQGRGVDVRRTNLMPLPRCRVSVRTRSDDVGDVSAARHLFRRIPQCPPWPLPGVPQGRRCVQLDIKLPCGTVRICRNMEQLHERIIISSWEYRGIK